MALATGLGRTSAPAANPVDLFLEISFSAFVLLRFSLGPLRVIRNGFRIRLPCRCFGRCRCGFLNSFIETVARAGAYSRTFSCLRLSFFCRCGRGGTTVSAVDCRKTVAVRRVLDFHILRDWRRRGGCIAENLRILQCRAIAPFVEDWNMRRTAGEEPSATGSKQETNNGHQTITGYHSRKTNISYLGARVFQFHSPFRTNSLINDSLHSERSGSFEVDRRFAAFRLRRAIVVDGVTVRLRNEVMLRNAPNFLVNFYGTTSGYRNFLRRRASGLRPTRPHNSAPFMSRCSRMTLCRSGVRLSASLLGS